MPLVLDVLRHGEAGPAGIQGDAARPLTASGRRAVAQLVRNLTKEGWRPDRIFSSPLLRARETAEIVWSRVRRAPPIEWAEQLLAERDPADVVTLLEAQRATQGHVLLVLHQPLAGRLSVLLTGEDAAFKPGTLVRIELPSGLGRASGRIIRSIHPGAAS